MVCLELPFLASLYPTFLFFFPSPKTWNKSKWFMSTFLKVVFARYRNRWWEFSFKWNFQFDVQLRAWTLKSQSFTSYKLCPAQSMAGRCLSPIPECSHLLSGRAQPVPRCPWPIWSPSGCLWLGAADPRAVWGQSGCRLGTAPVWTMPTGLRLLLSGKRGHRGNQRKWPSIVREAGQKEGGGFLPTIHIFCGMGGKKKKFSLELLFPSVVKQRVGHGGNGNRHSFNGWEIRRIILLLSHYMEKENIDVCLTMAEEVETSCLWWCHREEQKIIIEEKKSSIKHILHIISCAGMFLEPSLVCLVFHSSLIFPFFPLLLMLFLCE